MRASTLEAKFLHKISGMNQEVLCGIFIDIHKAYDALDRERALMIL